jgi:hypothetical protein
VIEKNIYAIRFGGHIELRVGSIAPITKVSKLTKMISVAVTRFEYLPSGVKIHYDKVPNKLVLKQVFFVGGKVMGYMRATDFEREFKLKVGKDKMVRLDAEQAKIIRSGPWRRKYL